VAPADLVYINTAPALRGDEIPARHVAQQQPAEEAKRADEKDGHWVVGEGNAQEHEGEGQHREEVTFIL